MKNLTRQNKLHIVLIIFGYGVVCAIPFIGANNKMPWYMGFAFALLGIIYGVVAGYIVERVAGLIAKHINSKF